MEDNVKGRLHLDIVVREGVAILGILAAIPVSTFAKCRWETTITIGRMYLSWSLVLILSVASRQWARDDKQEGDAGKLIIWREIWNWWQKRLVGLWGWQGWQHQYIQLRSWCQYFPMVLPWWWGLPCCVKNQSWLSGDKKTFLLRTVNIFLLFKLILEIIQID